MKKSVIYFIEFGILAIIVSFLIDTQFLQIVENNRIFFLDYFFLSIAFASNVFIMFFFLTALFLWKEHKRRWIIPLFLSSVLSYAITVLLKVLISRPRPFQENIVSAFRIIVYFIGESFYTWNTSFPSFQAVLVFSAVPILNREFKMFRHIWIIFAILVAFSRVYFGVHYLSDVVFGGLLGYAIGYIMVYLEEKYKVGKQVIQTLQLDKK